MVALKVNQIKKFLNITESSNNSFKDLKINMKMKLILKLLKKLSEDKEVHNKVVLN